MYMQKQVVLVFRDAYEMDDLHLKGDKIFEGDTIRNRVKGGHFSAGGKCPLVPPPPPPQMQPRSLLFHENI